MENVQGGKATPSAKSLLSLAYPRGRSAEIFYNSIVANTALALSPGSYSVQAIDLAVYCT
jgi:hypothetical protein